MTRNWWQQKLLSWENAFIITLSGILGVSLAFTKSSGHQYAYPSSKIEITSETEFFLKNTGGGYVSSNEIFSTFLMANVQWHIPNGLKIVNEQVVISPDSIRVPVAGGRKYINGFRVRVYCEALVNKSIKSGEKIISIELANFPDLVAETDSVPYFEYWNGFEPVSPSTRIELKPIDVYESKYVAMRSHYLTITFFVVFYVIAIKLIFYGTKRFKLKKTS